MSRQSGGSVPLAAALRLKYKPFTFSSLGFRRQWFSRSGSQTHRQQESEPDREEGRGRRMTVEEQDENEE